MGLFRKKSAAASEKEERKFSSAATTPAATSAVNTPTNGSLHSLPVESELDAQVNRSVPALAWILGAIASIGGFLFGYESGQISGFMLMTDFLERFGELDSATGVYSFSAVRSGTIVGLLSAGTLVGCLLSPWLADGIGRRYTISASAFFYIVGVVIEITSGRAWVQFAMGRFTAGLGIGALSTAVPMYQSESIPKAIRGAVVSSYQLLITLGIWTAYMINYGTEASYKNSAQWRIPNGLSALWAILLGVSVLFMPESPRFAYRIGRVEDARRNMARLNGVAPDSALINQEIAEIEEKLLAERAGGDHPWYEIFTGPRMLYRTLLGMVLMLGQQLTGANFFFYFGTTIFKSVGIENPYVTSIILGSVNVAATVVGLYVGQKYGRRNILIIGAVWMCVMFLLYSFVGHYELYALAEPNKAAGNALIVFTCLFICGFAISWGPVVWAVVGELYPARYRATCMALATSSNWLFNFLISFFTTFITNEINYWYGLVFGGCCAALAVIVFFFMIETKGRSLEEIDTMYMLHVNPITSASWDASSVQRDGLVQTDNMHLAAGGRAKAEEGGQEELMVHDERYAEDNATKV